MSHPFTYKGVQYPSKSQAALAMIGDHIPMEKVADDLGITPQTVFASKKRAEKRMLHNLLKIQKKAENAVHQAKELEQKTKIMSRMYHNLAHNFTDGRTNRRTRKLREKLLASK